MPFQYESPHGSPQNPVKLLRRLSALVEELPKWEDTNDANLVSHKA